MMNFILVGKAEDIFAEIDFMARLARATGHILIRYQPKININLN